MYFRYNPRNRTWVEIAPMHQPRVSHTMCAGKKGIFVVAGIDHVVEEGHDREIILNSVEYYCIQSGCWQVRNICLQCPIVDNNLFYCVPIIWLEASEIQLR